MIYVDEPDPDTGCCDCGHLLKCAAHSLQPGDRVHIVQAWDYGPPANPRMSYVVESVCDGGRSVCLWGQRAALPARCLRKVDHD